VGDAFCLALAERCCRFDIVLILIDMGLTFFEPEFDCSGVLEAATTPPSRGGFACSGRRASVGALSWATALALLRIDALVVQAASRALPAQPAKVAEFIFDVVNETR
jgi:hypothetical protein